MVGKPQISKVGITWGLFRQGDLILLFMEPVEVVAMGAIHLASAVFYHPTPVVAPPAFLNLRGKGIWATVVINVSAGRSLS